MQVLKAEDDWSGVGSPAARRTIQNRLAQRKYRQCYAYSALQLLVLLTLRSTGERCARPAQDPLAAETASTSSATRRLMVKDIHMPGWHRFLIPFPSYMISN